MTQLNKIKITDGGGRGGIYSGQVLTFFKIATRIPPH